MTRQNRICCRPVVPSNICLLAIPIVLVVISLCAFYEYEWTGMGREKENKLRIHSLVSREGRTNQENGTIRNKVSPSSVAYFHRVITGNTDFMGEISRNNLSERKHQLLNCTRQVQIWGKDIYNIRPRKIEACPGLQCGIRLVIDSSYQTLENSDAVLLFHLSRWNWAEMISHKAKGQKFIFFSHESPMNTRKNIIPPKEYYSRAYDYFMTFRFRYAQLYGSYGHYDANKPSIGLNDTRNWAGNRKRKVVWLASNCNMDNGWLHWNRTGFVKELSRLVDVGMYGKCGEHGACPSRHEVKGKMDFLTTCSGFIRQFKFYLALENSACRDYITEKLWNNAYMHDLVPIVFGPRRKDYEAVAPPNSFIHVEDFKTLRDLADYINLLDKNDHLYNKFFEWKKHGSVVTSKVNMVKWLLQPRNMCQVVNKLLADEQADKEGLPIEDTFPNLTDWWINSCRKIKQFPIKIS